MGFRSSEVTSAASWKSYDAGELPVSFANGRVPKAIMMNAAGNVVVVGEDGNSETFTPAIGILLQIQPRTITSTTAASVMVVFD